MTGGLKVRRPLSLQDLTKFDEKIKKAEKGLGAADANADKVLESVQKAAKTVNAIKD